MCPTQQPSSCDRKAKHRLAAQFANVSVNQDDPTARGKALVEEIETGVSNHSAANIAVRTACWRLAEAARSDTVLRRAVLMRGGLSAIFAAMRTFSTAADVQATACLALGTLMSCSTVADVDESPAINAGDALITRQVTNKAMMDDGGVDLIIKALRAHTTNECVQRGACYTLASDSFDASTRASLVAHGGPAVVVAVMNRYADQSAVQYRAIRALVTMTANDRSALLTEDVRAALQAAMQRWPAGPTYPVNPKSPAAGAKTLSPAILAVVRSALGPVWPVPVKPVQLS